MAEPEKPTSITIGCRCVWKDGIGWVLDEVIPKIQDIPNKEDWRRVAIIYVDLFLQAAKELNIKYNMIPEMMAGADSAAKDILKP